MFSGLFTPLWHSSVDKARNLKMSFGTYWQFSRFSDIFIDQMSNQLIEKIIKKTLINNIAKSLVAALVGWFGCLEATLLVDS